MLKKLLSLFGITPSQESKKTTTSRKTKSKPKVESTRIGELGEHKINIQLDQLPKDCKYISDVMITNAKSRSGYSQIDQVVISPYGVFVIETKNYNGEIKGSREDKQWSVSNRFKMYNPLKQNYGHIKALETLLSTKASLRFISMISFTMRCRFSIDPELRKIESDELIVYDVELSEFISRKMNRIKATTAASPLTSEEIEAVYQTIAKANIIDPALRSLHIKGAKGEK
jgi:hypothetical protein